MRILLASILVPLLMAPRTGHATSQSEVGVAAAVNTVTTGIPPVQPEHVLTIGTEIVHNERIITDSQGQTQLLFRDGSTFTVGENADVVIDDFVFDPQTTKGKLALSVTRGAFRFVGGKLSKDGSVEISTPAAVLGIRGGIVTGEVSEIGETTASLHFGDALTVTGRGGQMQTVTRAGFEITVPSLGAAPSLPHRTTREETNETVAHLVGKTTASGGAETRPTVTAVSAVLNSPSAPGGGLLARPSQLAQTVAAVKPTVIPAPSKVVNPVITDLREVTVVASQLANAQPIAKAAKAAASRGR
jgi:FecR protein